MKKLLVIILILPVMLVSAHSASQSKEFKAAKSLEVQLSILKELSRLYVDSVNVDKLVRTGIDAMLESLDPYTVYIPEEDDENLELLTTGSYGGIGALIKQVGKSIVISEQYENSPAAISGLVAGDTIVKVDTFSTENMKVDEVSAKMKGKPGTEVKFVVNKLKGPAGQELIITRQKIHFSDVEYSGMISDTTGYIRIAGFTLGGAKDVRKALLDLKSTGKMKRLVIDLRGNGGGILDEAVEIVSLFVPKGTLVVYSKGKIPQMDMKYFTKEEPVDTKLPLLVLVNSGSASSSEIVTGALQDLDRATIAGTRTFGKGLVQSIREVGFNDKIKLTTAKYYTPSGRCVQAIDYSHRNPDGSVGTIPDSLIKAFKTVNKGRTVYDGGGIAPDLPLKQEQYSRVSLSLVYNDIFHDWSVLYYKNHDKIEAPSKFTLTEAEYEDFVNYAVDKNFDYRTASEIEFDQLVTIAKREGLYESLKNVMDPLEIKVKLGKREVLTVNKKEIKTLLEEEICNRYYYQRGRIASIIRNDEVLQKAAGSVLVN
jgi:carboxyl-terminal processing protease